MTREEFEALLALEGVFDLRVQFIRGHRGKGRYWACLVYKPKPGKFIGTYAHTYSKTEACAVQKLIEIYANH